MPTPIIEQLRNIQNQFDASLSVGVKALLNTLPKDAQAIDVIEKAFDVGYQKVLSDAEKVAQQKLDTLEKSDLNLVSQQIGNIPKASLENTKFMMPDLKINPLAAQFKDLLIFNGQDVRPNENINQTIASQVSVFQNEQIKAFLSNRLQNQHRLRFAPMPQPGKQKPDQEYENRLVAKPVLPKPRPA